MVSEEVARTALGILGNIIAVTLFLSTVPTFYDIWKKKSVEQYSPVPYLASFFNCGLWVLYGMPFVHPHSLLVVTTNGAGVVIEIAYLAIFLMYSDPRKRLKVALMVFLEIVVFGGLVLFVLTLVHTTKKRLAIVGSISVAANILMYAAPLSVMKLVITTKSVEYMPFLLSFFSFSNGLCWFLYAFFPFDPFIAVPNGIGALLGIVQLILYATFYKSTKRILAARKEKTEMGMAVRPLATSSFCSESESAPMGNTAANPIGAYEMPQIVTIVTNREEKKGDSGGTHINKHTHIHISGGTHIKKHTHIHIYKYYKIKMCFVVKAMSMNLAIGNENRVRHVASCDWLFIVKVSFVVGALPMPLWTHPPCTMEKLLKSSPC